MARRSITLVNPIDEEGRWTPPRGYHGHFLPQSEWDPEDLRAFAAQIEKQKRRGKGRALRKRRKSTRPAVYPTYEQMYGLAREPDDVARAVRTLRDVCRGICEIESEETERNPIEALAIVNPRRSFGDVFVDFIDFLKENPLITAIGIGGLTLVGAGLFCRYGLRRTIPGIPALAGTGVVTVQDGVLRAPGATPYHITQQDRNWLGRMLYGEVERTPARWSSQSAQQGGAAVLWSMVNHYMTVGRKRAIYPTLGAFVQAYSQPISSSWADPYSSRCQQSPEACTAEKVAFRQRLRAKSFGNLPVPLQQLVTSFIAGRVGNPIGTRTDFRAAYTGTGWARDPLNVAGNVFGTNLSARLA